MKRSTAILLFVLAAGFVGWLCTFQVAESETVIVARFGDPSRVEAEPGLHFKWPAPIDSLLRVDQRVHVLDPEAAEYLTADKKNVLANYFVAWSVADPLRYVESTLGDQEIAEARLRDAVTAKVGTLLGSHDLEDLVAVVDGEAITQPSTTMGEINDALTARAAEGTEAAYGIRVEIARIKRLGFHRQNQAAVFRRMEAERTKIAKEIRAKGRETAEAIRSDTAKEVADILSQAQLEADGIRGQADAEARAIVLQAQGAAPELWRFVEGLEAARKIGPDDVIVLPSDHFLIQLLNDQGGAEDPRQ